ncbi:MAG: VCBS repeat-containing protein [Pyrinomonadaceae bacterium]
MSNRHFVHTTGAYSSGPPGGVTGAPGETTCVACHFSDEGSGQFTITAPPNYTPGQTYQIVVRHISSDPSRKRWGFEITSLAGTAMAGTLSSTTGTTQTFDGGNGRFYTEHSGDGTFPGQLGGAVWTFNWTAPSTNVGAVTFYSAGNQANSDGNTSGDRIITTTTTVQPAPPVVSRPPVFDFDGDDKTDISIFRPGPGEWWYLKSSDGGNYAAQFGNSTDKLVPGDYTGDDKTDIAVFRPSTGEWFILRSEDGSYYSYPFGTTGDLPAVGDFDGDGKSDSAVFRPSDTNWYIRRSSDNGFTIQQFGASGDVPAVADYDGDGKSDIAIWRASAGQWWIQKSSNSSVVAFQFGSSTDKPIQGDYTGDGKADVAIWRPKTGEWFILRSEDFSYYSFPFGTSGDVPAPGDFDGDGKFDATVFRPSESTWYVQRSTAGTLIQGFGISGDKPVPNAFVP